MSLSLLQSPNCILLIFLRPLGGSIKLNSADPFDAPLIDPNFLSTAFDIFAIREIIKAGLRFVAASPWKDYIVGPVGPLADANTDEEIEQYARGIAGSVWHMVGTASMSPKGADWGVVDPDLKVKGVEGVRVVDLSVVVSLGDIINSSREILMFFVGYIYAALYS